MCSGPIGMIGDLGATLASVTGLTCPHLICVKPPPPICACLGGGEMAIISWRGGLPDLHLRHRLDIKRRNLVSRKC